MIPYTTIKESLLIISLISSEKSQGTSSFLWMREDSR